MLLAISDLNSAVCLSSDEMSKERSTDYGLLRGAVHSVLGATTGPQKVRQARVLWGRALQGRRMRQCLMGRMTSSLFEGVPSSTMATNTEARMRLRPSAQGQTILNIPSTALGTLLWGACKP